MHTWRPKQSIRFLAIGLAWRDGALLAAEVYDDQGQLKGMRPLGGGVEFGEPWQDALRREFMEELGVEIDIVGPARFLENIYVHEGDTGHELVVAAEITLPHQTFAGQTTISFVEDGGQPCTARWVTLEYLRTSNNALYPDGLMGELTKA